MCARRQNPNARSALRADKPGRAYYLRWSRRDGSNRLFLTRDHAGLFDDNTGRVILRARAMAVLSKSE